MTPLYCPMCHAAVGKNEALVVQHDAIGTLIVRHYIPADVPINTGSHDDLRKAVANSPTTKLHFDSSYGTTNARHCCGSAGFKSATLER
jgi:hypothetical protein